MSVLTEVFSFQIKQGDARVSNGTARQVRIKFVNGKFAEATHNIEGEFVGTRDYWRVMGLIDQKIDELEGIEEARRMPLLVVAEMEAA